MYIKKGIKTAVEFLRDGQSFKVGDLRLDMCDSDLLIVRGCSRNMNFSNINRINSLEELAEIRDVFFNMVFVSNDLKMFISDKEIEYILSYDDGGKTSIDICSERNGIVQWQIP